MNKVRYAFVAIMIMLFLYGCLYAFDHATTF
jgi:hypothetical protein